MKIETTRDGQQHSWIELGALAVLTGVLAVVVGPFGIVAGIVTAVFWYVRGVPYALAAGFIVVVAVTPTTLSFVEIGQLTLAFSLLPAVASRRTVAPSVTLMSLFGSLLGLSLVGGVGYMAFEPWTVGLILFGTLAFVAYSIHRYELVRFDLVKDTDTAESTGDT
ncbi:hypothetical protein ACYJ1Y_17010 [Natrialbaceae archaeon A-gly3]